MKLNQKYRLIIINFIGYLRAEGGKVKINRTVPFSSFGLKRLPLIAFFYLFLVMSSLQQAVAENLEKAKEIALKGMEKIEMWDGRSKTLKEIEQIFTQALQIDPNSVEAITGMGRVIMRRAYMVGDQFDMDLLKVSLQYTDRALEIDKTYRKAHYLRGAVLSALGNQAGALKETDMLEALDKSLCDYMGLRDVVYRRQGKIQDGIKEHLNELSCPSTDIPRKIKIYNSIGDFYMDAQDYTNAVKYYKESIKLMPGAPHTYGNLSRALMYQDDLDEAEEMAYKAIGIMDYPMVHVYLKNIYLKRGDKYAEQGKYTEAEKEYFRSLEEDSQFMPAYFGLADIYFKSGDCDKAVEAARRILEIYPKYTIAKKIIMECKGELKKDGGQ